MKSSNRKVEVRLEYEPDPENLLSSLTEFIFKHAGSIDFSNSPPDSWLTIFKGVTVSLSKEHRVFKTNLEILIRDNIRESGYDPRVAGPPQHVLE